MTKGATVRVGVLLLIAAAALGALTYGVRQKADEAEARTMRLAPGETLRLRPDTQVQVELFGPNRRAADQAKTKENVLIGLTVATGVAGLAFLGVGLFKRKPPRSNCDG